MRAFIQRPILNQSKLVIRLKDVGLEIPVFTTETRTLKSVLLRSVTGGALRRGRSGAVITALKNVTCDIKEGERIALIGHNGAGKSTFLKLISGIYFPSKGKISRYAKVVPMIKKSFITSGELSGYQAMKAHYLLINERMLGFENFEVDVIDFSGLGDFIHLPVKTYSEGMAARLLFSILTSFSHECLVMDEGFGAGDASFYDKAQLRLHSFIKNAGTLVLASHSEPLLRQFCKRGLVFDQGSIVFDGNLNEALDYYHDFA